MMTVEAVMGSDEIRDGEELRIHTAPGLELHSNASFHYIKLVYAVDLGPMTLPQNHFLIPGQA